MRSLTKKRKIQEKKRKLKRTVYWVVVSFIILYVLFGARFNLIHYIKARRDNKFYQEQLQKFIRENENLKEQIKDLRKNPETWERIAREKYGMQKKNERVIYFQDHDE